MVCSSEGNSEDVPKLKDYEVIAGVIAGRVQNVSMLQMLEWTTPEQKLAQDVIADLAMFMASRLAQDNDKFDRDKFLTTCGVK